MVAPRVHDAGGRIVSLGVELGRGGEGSVHEVTGDPSLVAKLYHEHPGSEKVSKLQAMVSVANPDILKVSAWPVSTLHSAPSGQVVGLLMPRISGYQEIHELYSPAHRKMEFPKATWRFLVRTASNLSRVFDTIHTAGHVIGDVNQGNVVVADKALAKLIDCDSFQISVNGRTFPCEVGVGHFTPPELQGRTFRGIVRTPNHDNFGLAILCFHLLFMGRHPFAGRFLGVGDMPIERAITEYRFAFSASGPNRQMTPPPHALLLADASNGVAALFERAFGYEGSQGLRRPTAREWTTTLEKLEQDLTTCSHYPAHCYLKTLPFCPWCKIEKEGGPYFFVSLVSTATTGSAFDLTRVWAAISAIPALPGVVPLAVELG